MENSGFPSIFAETAPINNILVVNKPQEIIVDALKDDLIANLDQIEPRIKTLKDTLDQIIVQADAASKNIGSDLSKEVTNLLPNVSNIHNISIQTSRRIQSLGLNQQTVSTLSVPKQLRPVHDEFFAFKEEFDTSLKNVASLSRSITQRIDMLSATFDSLKDIPKNIEKSLEEVSLQLEKTASNTKKIEELRCSIEQEINQSHASILDQFDSKIKEAETLVDELNEKANEGLNSSTLMGEQLQTEKFDMKTSFQDLLIEMQKTTNDKLDDAKKRIEKENIDTSAEINDLHEELSQELNELTQDQSEYGVTSLLDEIEKEKEMSELEQLIERFNNLAAAIKATKTRPIGSNYEDHEGMWEGRKVVFRCFDDGTFKIQETN